MALGLSLYRGLTSALGAVLVPVLRAIPPARRAWGDALVGAGAEDERAAGGVWIHAASMGEVGAARVWAGALASSGARPPFLLTTRTRTGLDRAARELGALVAPRLAPIDVPSLLRGMIDTACPARLDIVETEIWPNLIVETRRARVAVAFVSATVSERTSGRLARLGLAGPDLLGDGVFVLAQTEADAGRFAALGVPVGRIRVAGDLKADATPDEGSARPAADRPAVVFGSLRHGEEGVAVRIAEALEGAPGRPLLIVAPRHDDGARAARAALTAAGRALRVRDEAARSREPLASWIAGAASAPGPRVALLETHGELAAAYALARVAVIGGTFAPYGGHNPIEAASRGAPVVVGPHHDAISAALGPLEREGAATVATDASAAAAAVLDGWREATFAARSAAASRGARATTGAASRAIAALADWGLAP